MRFKGFLETGSVGDDLNEDGSAFQSFGAAEKKHLIFFYLQRIDIPCVRIWEQQEVWYLL